MRRSCTAQPLNMEYRILLHGEDVTDDVNIVPVEERGPDEHPPRCPECSGIVSTSFRGQLLPPGVGFCVVHNVVKYYQGGRR